MQVGKIYEAVKENRIGIAPKHLSKIFERYYEVEDQAI